MMSENVAEKFDSDCGPVYKSEASGDLFVVVSRPEFGAGDDAEVEIERVSDGEWYGVFQDNFNSGYRKVADTLGEVDF